MKQADRVHRFDTTLRVTIWLDLFWSVVVVVVCAVGWPLALLSTPGQGLVTVLMIVSLTGGVFLAATGAVAAVLLMVRLGQGHYFLPDSLRLPLPRWMRPDA